MDCAFKPFKNCLKFNHYSNTVRPVYVRVDIFTHMVKTFE